MIVTRRDIADSRAVSCEGFSSTSARSARWNLPEIFGGIEAFSSGLWTCPSRTSRRIVPRSPSTEWNISSASCIRSWATRFAPRSRRHVPFRKSFGRCPTTTRKRVGPRSSTIPSMVFSPKGLDRLITTISPCVNRCCPRCCRSGCSKTRMSSPYSVPFVRPLSPRSARPDA